MWKKDFCKIDKGEESAQTIFSPQLLPPKTHVLLDYDGLLLLQATIDKLQAFDKMVKIIPNIKNYLRMLLNKTALCAIQSEGYEIDFIQFLDPKTNKYNNRGFAAVINYLRTIDFALSDVEEKQIDAKFIKEVQAVLAENSDNRNFPYEKYRDCDGFILRKFKNGREIKHMVPPHEEIVFHMLDLEKFINIETGIHVLVKTALIYYQLEMIHPFLESSSKLSRLISMAYLFKTKILSVPALALATYFEENEEEYCDSLIQAAAYNKYQKWIKLFLKTLYQATNDAIISLTEMVNLQSSSIERILSEGKWVNISFTLLTYFELNPITEMNQMSKVLKMSPSILSKVIKKMGELEILSYSTKEDNKTVDRITCDKYIEIITKKH